MVGFSFGFAVVKIGLACSKMVFSFQKLMIELILPYLDIYDFSGVNMRQNAFIFLILTETDV